MHELESKPLQKLRNRIEQEKQHLQMLDVALISSHKSSANSSGSLASALGYDERKYDHLNIPANQSSRLMTQAKNNNYRSSIIQLYTIWTDYMREILGLLYEKTPHQIAQKAPGQMSYIEIIKAGSYEELQRQIINNVFRSLEEERNTKKLMEKILKHTKIGIDSRKKTNALAYLEMRHLFIHNSGVADQKFNSKYRDIIHCDADRKLPTKFYVVESAYNAVIDLCREIDILLIRSGFIKSRKEEFEQR